MIWHVPRKINRIKTFAKCNNNVKINLDPNKIIFYIDKVILLSKLIDGSFPNYEKVIPTNNNNILHVKRSTFCEAIDRVSTITNEKSPAIKFTLLQNLMNLASINAESGSATEDIETEYKQFNV